MQRGFIEGLVIALALSGCATDGAGSSLPKGTPAVGGSSAAGPSAGVGIGVGTAGVLAVIPPQSVSQAGTGLLPRAGTAAPILPAAGSGAPIVPPSIIPPKSAAGGGAVATAGVGAPPVAGTGAMPIPTATGGTDPVLPMAKGDCPKIATGPLAIMGATIQLTVGAKSATQKGPIMIYWHGTGGTALTAAAELGGNVVGEITASGGVLASMESGGKGNAVDWGVFTSGDFEIVDQIVACAVQQLNIDTRRIYTSGASAGGLAAGTLAFARSSYMAASNPNSGGVAPWPGNNILADPNHVPAALTMHGAMGVDMVVIDFGTASMDMDKALAAKGGFAVDCNHGGGHVGAPPDLKAAGWEFMKAHPFGTKPSPYANGLPASFPKYCTIVK